MSPKARNAGNCFEALGEVEIVGIVDREFAPEPVPFFEVLLEMGSLVLDVQARLDAVSDHPCAVAVRGRRRAWGDSSGKQQPNAIRATQVEIVPNHRFEEVTTLDRTVEDLRETDFQLAECDAMIIACGPILGPHRPGEAMRPPIEERVNVTGAERVTRRLQDGGIGTREKAVVRLSKRIRCRRSCCLTHSWPFKQILIG